MRDLQSCLDPTHARFGELLVLEQRLRENLAAARVLGETEQRRAERAAILAALNQFALATTGSSFNDLVRQAGITGERVPTRVVEQLPRADYTSIAAAIQAARPGDRILVRPGVYEESLVIDTPIEIIGDGAPGTVVVQARSSPVLQFVSPNGRVQLLTIRQLGTAAPAVDIAGGSLSLEDCIVTGAGPAGVRIRDGAFPSVRNCVIRDGAGCGVLVTSEAEGIIEQNRIMHNAGAGIDVTTGGDPLVQRNYIAANHTGIRVRQGGRGGYFENVLRWNRVGWQIARDCRRHIRRARNRG